MSRRIRNVGIAQRLEFATQHRNHLATEQLELVRHVLPEGVRAIFVTQAEALGLGHAVLCAKEVIGDEPFAVLLPDDLIWNRGAGALKQMADAAEASGASMIAVQDVPHEATGSYGIVATDAFDGRQGRINAIVVLSDGQDTDSAISLDSLVAKIGKSSREGGNDAPVRIFPIAYGEGADTNALATSPEPFRGNHVPSPCSWSLPANGVVGRYCVAFT